MAEIPDVADVERAGKVVELCAPCSPKVFESIEEHLQRAGAVTSVGLLLRMREPFFVEYQDQEDGSYWIDELFRRSLFESVNGSDGPLDIVRREWGRIAGARSPWFGVLEFPALHACALRGPVTLLGEFFRLPALRGNNSPVAGIVLPVPLSIPERSIHNGPMPVYVSEILDRVREITYSDDCGNLSSKQLRDAQKILKSPECVAAISWLGGVKKLLVSQFGEEDPTPKRLRAVLGHLRRCIDRRNGNGSIPDLGIGDLRCLGSSPGRGQKVCVLDSGADESSPFLQRCVLDYARFDTLSQHKEAYACMDFGCHGTKVASLICGQGVSLRDIGFDESFIRRVLGQGLDHWGLSDGTIVQPGVAPGAMIGVFAVLGGDPLAETGDTVQVLAGLERAAASQDYGYSVVNISVEAPADRMDENTQQAITRVLDIMQRRGILPVLAAGNHGESSVALGHNACVVGAADPNRDPSPTNGPYFDLLAPGVDVLCGQPRIHRLGNLLVDKYSGSSVSTAIVSGSIAGLCGAVSGVSSKRAFEALVATADRKFIRVDAAYAWLLHGR